MSASDKGVTASAPRGQPDKATRANSKYARKQQAIIAAASEILNRDGVKGMTLANVAGRVGLITTSVTYYFRKKEDLAVACFLDAISRAEALADEAALESDPPARVRRMLKLWLDPDWAFAVTVAVGRGSTTWSAPVAEPAAQPPPPA